MNLRDIISGKKFSYIKIVLSIIFIPPMVIFIPSWWYDLTLSSFSWEYNSLIIAPMLWIGGFLIIIIIISLEKNLEESLSALRDNWDKWKLRKALDRIDSIQTPVKIIHTKDKISTEYSDSIRTIFNESGKISAESDVLAWDNDPFPRQKTYTIPSSCNKNDINNIRNLFDFYDKYFTENRVEKSDEIQINISL